MASGDSRLSKVLVVTFTVLTAPRGDSTNERETISCLQTHFDVYVFALRKVFPKAAFDQELLFEHNVRMACFPYVDLIGLRLVQAFFFSLFASLLLISLKLLGLFKPSAVIVTHPLVGTIVSLTSHVLKTPVLYRVHSVPLLSEEDPFRAHLLGDVFRFFDITALSSSSLIQVATSGAKRRLSNMRTILIPYSVDPAFFLVKHVDDGVFTLGYLGSFGPTRDFSEYMSAVSVLTTEMPNLRVQLIGYGAKKQEIRDLVKALNLQNVVQVLPVVSHDQVPRIMSSFDALVNPQLPENTALSTKIIEAMAGGVPVITTVPQLGLLEHGRNCLLVQNQQKSYESAILTLCNDRELWETISLNARKTAEAVFSRRAVAELYRKAVDSIRS